MIRDGELVMLKRLMKMREMLQYTCCIHQVQLIVLDGQQGQIFAAFLNMI